MTGAQLLTRARAMSPAELDAIFGSGATTTADTVERPAAVAALITEHEASDLELIRHLTRCEMAAITLSDGCGDVLLACCWLLFLHGRVEDSALIWAAKQLSFDTACNIDSVFLVPGGIPATAGFARSEGHQDLLVWVDSEWLSDPADVADEWRAGFYFRECPPATAPISKLAQWLQS